MKLDVVLFCCMRDGRKSLKLFISSFSYLTALSLDLLYISVVTTFIIIKLSGVLADPIDPFIPVENAVSFLALGGLWDNISESNGNEQQE